ncbi:MAG: hypothetical protein ACFFFH_09310 [Candidatus Thorarchaeota archaeon]
MYIKKILIIYLVIFLILLRISNTYTILLPLDDPLKYKVNIGDFQIYKYTEFYDSRLPDPNKDFRYVRDIYGKFRNFTIEKGVNFKIIITDVGEDYVSGTRTINNVTIKEYGLDLLVRPMMDNLSLLAESLVGDARLQAQSNTLIERLTETSFYSQGILYNLNRSRISIWEESGWLSYLFIQVYDIENLYYELEIEKQVSQDASNELTGLILLSFNLILLGYLLFMSKRNK